MTAQELHAEAEKHVRQNEAVHVVENDLGLHICLDRVVCAELEWYCTASFLVGHPENTACAKVTVEKLRGDISQLIVDQGPAFVLEKAKSAIEAAVAEERERCAKLCSIITGPMALMDDCAFVRDQLSAMLEHGRAVANSIRLGIDPQPFGIKPPTLPDPDVHIWGEG